MFVRAKTNALERLYQWIEDIIGGLRDKKDSLHAPLLSLGHRCIRGNFGLLLIDWITHDRFVNNLPWFLISGSALGHIIMLITACIRHAGRIIRGLGTFVFIPQNHIQGRNLCAVQWPLESFLILSEGVRDLDFQTRVRKPVEIFELFVH